MASLEKLERIVLLMGNITSYVDEFRNTSFREKKFDEVDSLLFSQLSYYNFCCGAFAGEHFSKTIAEVLHENYEQIIDATTTIKEDDIAFLEALKEEGRHGSLRASNYVARLDEEAEKQFSAMVIELQEKEYYIVFRGTDNNVTGWKEDMAMCYEEFVPAQKDALEYAIHIMDKLEGNFYIGGHSKGGNLAVYTAIHLPYKYRRRLLGVFDHDGPGFVEAVYVGEAYWKVRPLIYKTIPKSSVVGLMWQADENYKVVLSDEKLLAQHDPFTWIVIDGEFAVTRDVDAFAKYTKAALESWLDTYSRAERAELVDIVFDTIYGAGIDSFDALTEDTLPNVLRLIAEIADTTPEDRAIVFEAAKQLLQVYKKEIPVVMKAERDAVIEERAQKIKQRLALAKEEMDKKAQSTAERYEELRKNLLEKAEAKKEEASKILLEKREEVLRQIEEKVKR